MWCGHSICCGFRKEYVLLDTTTTTTTELFSTGKSQETFILSFGDELILNKE
eukprot:Pgem_evm1s13128